MGHFYARLKQLRDPYSSDKCQCPPADRVRRLAPRQTVVLPRRVACVTERNCCDWSSPSRSTEHGGLCAVHRVCWLDTVRVVYNGQRRQKSRSFISRVPRMTCSHIIHTTLFIQRSIINDDNWIAGHSMTFYRLLVRRPVNDKSMRSHWFRYSALARSLRRLVPREIACEKNTTKIIWRLTWSADIRTARRACDSRSILWRRCGSLRVQRWEMAAEADRKTTERDCSGTSRQSRDTRRLRCFRARRLATRCRRRIRRHSNSSSSIWRHCTNNSCSSVINITINCSNSICKPAAMDITTLMLLDMLLNHMVHRRSNRNRQLQLLLRLGRLGFQMIR